MEVTSQPGGDSERTAPGPTQSEDRTKPNFEPTQDEKTVVTRWLERVQRAEDKPERKAWFDLLEKLRGYVRGTKHEDKSGAAYVRTNMVFATMAAQVPELYAKNPKLEVTPTDAVPQAEMGKVKKFAATGERVLDQCLIVEGKLKKRMKSGIRATSTTGYGVLKLLYQEEYRGDPVAVRRMEDTQDNLARVEGLILALKKEDDPALLAQKRDELKANVAALKSGNEVRMFKGFTVDRMKSEDFVVLDDSIVEFDEYEDAEALGHFIWMTVGRFKELMNMEPIAATKYGRPREKQAQTGADNTPLDEMFVCVVEIWDKKNGVVRTTAKGMSRWCREPYVPQHTPQRWYPFYVIGYNLTEDQWRPLSDVELLMGLQDEYNDTRTNYADARRDAVPKRVFRKSGGLTEEDLVKLRQQGNREWVGVEGNPAIPLSQDIMQLDGVPIKPEAYDTTLIRNDMDMVAGRSDASRANLIKPKTATEAEIMQEAMQTRMGERRDVNEDVMSDIASATLEIALRCLTKGEVEQLAGPDCEWPDTPQGAEDCFRNVAVRVRAGSSGKPNAMKDREQWTQLMPIIEKTMQTVGELRMNGNFELADQAIALLKETLHRFDEHLDLDSIIPPAEPGVDGQPGAAAQTQQKLMQATQQLTELQEELQKCKDALTKAQAGEEAKVAKINADAELAKQKIDREDALARDRLKQEADLAREEIESKAETAVLVAEIQADSSEAVAASKPDAEGKTREKKTVSRHKQMTERFEKLLDEIDRARGAQEEHAGAVREQFASVGQSTEQLAAVLSELKDVIGAEKVIDYGPDGMPRSVRRLRKGQPLGNPDMVVQGPNGMPSGLRPS